MNSNSGVPVGSVADFLKKNIVGGIGPVQRIPASQATQKNIAANGFFIDCTFADKDFVVSSVGDSLRGVGFPAEKQPAVPIEPICDCPDLRNGHWPKCEWMKARKS